MLQDCDLFVAAMIEEREQWARRLAREHALLDGARPHRHTLRERAGMWLIHAGRALLRQTPAYRAARRRLA